MRHHGAGLLRLTHNQALVDAIVTGPTLTESSPADCAMLKYAVQLTLQPDSLSEEDVQVLRKHNFSDHAILEINLAASYMNFVNRIALGLGVELEESIQMFKR